MNVDISDALKVTGWMRPAELRWLAEQASKHQRILEIGSYHGRSTVAMLDNSKAQIWCIDAWNNSTSVSGKSYNISDKDYNIFLTNTERYSGRLSIIRGDGEIALKKLRMDGELFDMVFVDDGHAYEFAYPDIFNSLPLITPGGLICGHDYNQAAWPGVVKAVNELVPGFSRVKNTSLWWKII